MAIAEIKKIELIGLKKDKQRVLALLQDLAVIHLLNIREESAAGENLPPDAGINLSELEEAILFLAAFKEEGGLLSGMVTFKPQVLRQQLQDIVSTFDYQGLLRQLSGLRNRQKNLEQHKERLLEERQALVPWRNLKIPLDKLRQTNQCGIVLGVLRSRDYSGLFKDCAKAGVNLFWEIVKKDKTNTRLAILYLQEEFEQLDKVLKGRHFNFVTLSRRAATAQDRLLEINREVIILDDQLLDVKNQIAAFSQERFKLMAIYDFFNNMRKVRDADKSLSGQQFTFGLSAWIRRKDIKFLEQRLSQDFSEAAIFVSDPQEGQDIPTALENKPVIQPFEVVTNLYGQPIYQGLDPTLFLAPFFAVSFGFCLLDAGYGLLVILLSLYYLNKKNIGIAGKNFWKLFLLVGSATVIAGLITGNFFGDLISRLPGRFDLLKGLQRKITVLDPVKESFLFLGLTLCFGFIQVLTGVLIKFVKDLRSDKFSAFILDLPTCLVQISLFILVLAAGKAIPASAVKYAGILFLLSSALIVYYQWVSNKGIILKLFWSLFGIYSVVTGNFLADTLSFSRIFALGLTGGLLGMVINEILFPKNIACGFIPLITASLMFVFLAFAHLLNCGISFLGAYVHSSRLQYLEFFSKFFESGGKPFKPFKIETKYIFLTEK